MALTAEQLRHTKQEDGMKTGNPVIKNCFFFHQKPVTSVMRFFTFVVMGHRKVLGMNMKSASRQQMQEKIFGWVLFL